MKNIKLFSIKKSFKDYMETNSLVSLGNSFELPVLIRNLSHRLVCACFPGLVKPSSRTRQIYNFSKYLLNMTKHHGPVFTVKYLKACQLAMQKAVAGTPIQSLREIEPDLPLPRLTSSGLPRYIPRMDRRAILNESLCVIRW